MRSRTTAALPVLAYLAGLNLFFMPAQVRVWNYLNGLDVLVRLGLIIPFVATRWLSPSSLRATRIAWYLAAVMALDIIRISTVALGLVCLVCESVYIVPFPNHPFEWLLFRSWRAGMT